MTSRGLIHSQSVLKKKEKNSEIVKVFVLTQEQKSIILLLMSLLLLQVNFTFLFVRCRFLKICDLVIQPVCE